MLRTVIPCPRREALHMRSTLCGYCSQYEDATVPDQVFLPLIQETHLGAWKLRLCDLSQLTMMSCSPLKGVWPRVRNLPLVQVVQLSHHFIAPGSPAEAPSPCLSKVRLECPICQTRSPSRGTPAHYTETLEYIKALRSHPSSTSSQHLPLPTNSSRRHYLTFTPSLPNV
jgi:hypothetical protein